MHWWKKFGFGLVLSISILIKFNHGQKHEKIEAAMLDIVLVLDDSGSIDDNEHRQMVDVMRKLPEVFEIGPKNCHVATVVFSNDATVRQNFTDDLRVFNNSLRFDRDNGWTHTTDALRKVHDEVLPTDRRPDVTNVIIIFTDGCTNDGRTGEETNSWKNAVGQANRLLNQSNIIFLVHTGQEKRCEPHQWDLVGNIPGRRFHVEDFDNLTTEIFKKIKTETERLHCAIVEECYYTNDDKTTCIGEKKQVVVKNCIQVKLSVADCTIEKCEHQCKDHWLVNGSCSKWCSDPRGNNCTACERCLIQPTITTTIESAKMTNLGAGLKNGQMKDDGKSESDTSSPWLFIGIAIGVGLLLILLLIFAFIVVRKRRQRARIHAAMKKAEIERGPNSSISKSKSKSKSKTRESGSRKPSSTPGWKTLPSSQPSGPPIHSKATKRSAAAHQNEDATTEKFRPTSRAMRKTLSTELPSSKKHHRRSSTTPHHDKKMRKGP